MKNKILQLNILLAFSVLLLPLRVKAMLPDLQATELATNFANQVAIDFFTDATGTTLLTGTMSEIFRNSGLSPSANDTYTVTNNDFNIDLGIQHCYNSNGEEIDSSNIGLSIGRGQFASYTFLYDKTTGEILNIGSTFQGSESSLNAYQPNGGVRANAPVSSPISINGVPTQDPFTTFSDAWFDDTNPLSIAVTRPDDLTTDKINWFNTLPSASWGVNEDGNAGFYCVANVPNVCVQSNVPSGYETGTGHQIPNFFLNDGYKEYLTIWGSSQWFPNSVYYETNTYGGYTYTMRYPHNGANTFAPDDSVVHISNVDSLNQDLQNVSFLIPVDNQNSVGDTVNYTNYTTRNVNKYTTINNNYDQTKNITENNFPITQNITYPNYTPTFNYYTIYNETVNNPNTGGGDIGNIESPSLPSDIPILSNLEKRFPFSIPFDIYNLLTGLAVERETPYIDTTINIPCVNYDWHIDYDLSAWNGVASLFRTLFLISFIIGLAWFSYDHFFGN